MHCYPSDTDSRLYTQYAYIILWNSWYNLGNMLANFVNFTIIIKSGTKRQAVSFSQRLWSLQTTRLIIAPITIISLVVIFVIGATMMFWDHTLFYGLAKAQILMVWSDTFQTIKNVRNRQWPHLYMNCEAIYAFKCSGGETEILLKYLLIFWATRKIYYELRRQTRPGYDFRRR